MGEDDRPHARVRLAVALVAAAAVLAAVAGAQARSSAVKVGGDWARFGYDAARHDSGPAATGITAANVGSLRAQRVALDGTVDSSAVYVRGVRGRDLAIVTTTYGKTEAIDARTGLRVWRFTPPGYATWAGSPQITNATPIVDRALGAVFAAAPDGRVRRLDLATGRLRWTATVTLLPSREKLTSSLNLTAGRPARDHGRLLRRRAALPGPRGLPRREDRPRPRGLELALRGAHRRSRSRARAPSPTRRSGRGPARSSTPPPGACSSRPGTRPSTASATSATACSCSRPTGRRWSASYTPTDYVHLNVADLDLGSTAPALLAGGYAVQGGKDGMLRLLGPAQLSRAPGSIGGELQTVPTPGGDALFSAPAVWQGTWLFVADGSGTAAWQLTGGRLVKVWENGTSGTSPVVAGGLLYVLSLGGGVNVYRPVLGTLVTTLPTGSAHWQSPIVTDGRVIVAEGNANDHATKGVVDIFRLAGA